MAETTIEIDLRVLWQGIGPATPEAGTIITAEAVDADGEHERVSGRDVTFYGAGAHPVDAATGVALVSVPVTDGTFCIRWRIRTPRGRMLERHTLAPASATPIPFGSLQQVDPKTFAPTTELVAAWASVAREASAARDEAVGSVIAIAGHATAAAASADEADASAISASGWAAAATGQAENAEVSATLAGQRAADAGAGAAAAASSAEEAGAAAERSDTAADASEASRALAEGHAGGALASSVAAAGSAEDAALDRTLAAAAAVDANSSRTAAAGSATSAAGSAAAADASKTSAFGHAVDAQNAAAAAEAERVRAENASAGVVAARDAAVAARDVAEGFKTSAEAAKTGADAAKTGAENARAGAETARSGSETAKTGAEAARDAALAGQMLGTAVTSAADLNTFQTPGRFRFSGGATASANLPVPKAGVLDVRYATGSTNVQQEYRPFSSSGSDRVGFYQRSAANSSTTWDAWQYFPPQKAVTSATQPGVEITTYVPGVGDVPLLTGVITLGSTTDLNNVTSPGVYRQDVAGNANTSLNYPVTNQRGMLRVWPVSAPPNTLRVIQEWIPQNSNVAGRGYWSRIIEGSTFGPWRFFSGQRTNKPADQPGTEVFTWNDSTDSELGLSPIGIDLGTSDLNTVALPGTYQLQLASNATLARNYPRANAGGVLEVLRLGTSSGGRIMQRFTIQNGDASAKMAGIYQRRMWDGTWDPWVFIPSQIVDETAGRRIFTFDPVNNRPQMIYGDTGWRDITSLLTTGWTGQLRIRRTGYRVAIRGTIVRNDSTTAEFLQYISGFKAYAVDDYGVAVVSSASRLITGSSTGLSISASVAGSTANRIISDFDTAESWPAALPGTPLGAIPAT